MPVTTSVDEFLKHEKEGGITDFKNPNCNNCSECCSLMSMITPKEYKFYIKYFTKDKKGKEIIKQALKKWQNKTPKNSVNFTCPFISKTKRCLIYQIRPTVCREFHCSPTLNRLDKHEIMNSEHYTLYNVITKVLL